MKFVTYEVTFAVEENSEIEKEIWTKTWFEGNVIDVCEKDKGYFENTGGMI